MCGVSKASTVPAKSMPDHSVLSLLYQGLALFSSVIAACMGPALHDPYDNSRVRVTHANS